MKNNEKTTRDPVVIISAARSGTKLLRRILSSSIEFGGCPYDANYIWKIGNLSTDHDALNPEELSDKQVAYIRAFFDRARARDRATRIVEKTVSNSLRVPLVKKVFPTSKIIHLYRNGRAASLSTRRCWETPPTSNELQSRNELCRKLWEFPYFHGWPYLTRYLKNYAKKYAFGKRRVGSWGVRYKGIDRDLEKYGIEYVATKQWAECVQHSSAALGSLEEGVEYINVSFENLVCKPETELEKILDFVAAEHRVNILSSACSIIDPSKAQVPAKADARDLTPEISKLLFDGQEAIETLMRGGHPTYVQAK